MKHYSAFIFGGLFGIGLVVSGATDTRVILGGLDVFGQWDPRLGIIFAPAATIMALAWLIANRRGRALLGREMPARPAGGIDRRLVSGSLIFGLGWGMAGLCPGPAIVALTFGGWKSAVFFAAMVTGMLIARPVTLRMDSASARIPVPA